MTRRRVRSAIDERIGRDGTRDSVTEPDAAVVLRGITKSYGDAIAVNDLDMSVSNGEFISLLGPSGCGKTTTLRMIAGFEQPDAGEILVNGRSVLGVPPYKRHVNTVFQAYALFPHMTVAENVAYGLRQRRTPKSEIADRVAEALDLVQMRRFADRKPTQLSGGQQQRVALTRALVNRPSVLLLDEPLAALDRQLREEMQVELKLLQSRLGISFVFVTHDQAEALAMSDRIAIMRDGGIEQLSDADTIYSSPASAYVAGFIGQQNFFDGHVVGLGVQVPTVGTLIPADHVDGFGEGSAVRAAIRPEFIDVSEVNPDVATNCVEGTVVGIAHQGETRQYMVSVGVERPMLIRRPTPTAPRVEVGDTVWCSWRPDHVKIFPSPGGEVSRTDHATHE